MSTISSLLSPRKRPLDAAPVRQSKKQAAIAKERSPHYQVTKHFLASLGGGWTNTPPFAGDENHFYRWIAEPALWARVVLGDVEPRTQQRLIGLHAGLHDAIDASGFVLWRTFPPAKRGLFVSLKTAASPGPQRLSLPNVSIKQAKLTPSSHFARETWACRTHVGPPANPTTAPAWLRGAWSLIQTATFPFLGSPMPVVDAAWSNDRFARSDAVTHALCEVPPPAPPDEPTSGGGNKGFGASVRDWVLRGSRGRGGGSGSRGGGPSSAPSEPVVAAAAIETPFPAERLLRSLAGVGKDDQVLYIDAIVADKYGAAYRLLCDMVSARQAADPDRRLVVVLMAVVSSDVLGRYARWGFSYGGIMPYDDRAPVLVDRVDCLHRELSHFEHAMRRTATSPTSVVNDAL